MPKKFSKSLNQKQKEDILLNKPLEEWVAKCIRANEYSYVHLFPGQTSDSIKRKNLYSSFRTFLSTQKETTPVPPLKFSAKVELILKKNNISFYKHRLSSGYIFNFVELVDLENVE